MSRESEVEGQEEGSGTQSVPGGLSAAKTDEQRLREMLLSVYLPEGVELWLAHAEKHGWSIEFQLQRAEQLVTGAFT